MGPFHVSYHVSYRVFYFMGLFMCLIVGLIVCGHVMTFKARFHRAGLIIVYH